MNRTDLLEALQTTIGHRFKDPSLLETALTHRSFTNESQDPMEDNERLEFLGDAVVNLVVADRTYALEPDWDEGRLTRLKALVVCGPALAEKASDLGLGELLLLGRGAARSDRVGQASSALSNVFESVVGAVYLDGGFDTAQRFILSQLDPAIQACLERGRLTDPKSSLQAACLRESHQTPVYQVVGREGPDHAPQFTIRVVLPDGVGHEGTGGSRKEAEQAAALNALNALGIGC
ncbi:MAG: ribonuclease III [Deltaproteobacteria bacterium]|nr:ribonuclease III [Deltaproteobacteria bacterium]